MVRVWLATRNSLTAHRDPECGALTKRPSHLPDPIEQLAQDDPDRAGWVMFRYVVKGQARWRSSRLCSWCGNGD